jgi:predicted Zn-dependent peptidase
MRLDFYGNTNTWQEGLSYHRRWLEGVPFTQKVLEAEKPKVNSECDYAVKNLATHKFAVAAWNQAFRHGKKNVAMKGDVQRAGLAEIQRHRDEHLAVLDRVTVCVVGGVEPKHALATVARNLGGIKSTAGPVEPVKITPGNRDVTWDLAAQHLLFTWPIPHFTNDDYAALMALAQWLNMELFSDVDLKGMTGMVFAGADLTTPEGTYFYISASLKPSASADNVRDKLKRHIEAVTSGEKALNDVPILAKQLSFSLTNVPEPAMVKAQAPATMTMAMIEGNIGLQLGMHEFRYGTNRSQLAQRLAKVTALDGKRAAQKHLSAEKLAVCTIRPAKAN